MRGLLVLVVLLAFIVSFNPVRIYGQLLVTDDFQSYAASPLDQCGGTGPWTWFWAANLEFGGGIFLDNSSNIDGTQSVGAYGSDSIAGTSVSRPFPACARTTTLPAAASLFHRLASPAQRAGKIVTHTVITLVSGRFPITLRG